jgi:hypothetical protein
MDRQYNDQKKYKGQRMVYKTLPIKLKIELLNAFTSSYTHIVEKELLTLLEHMSSLPVLVVFLLIALSFSV